MVHTVFTLNIYQVGLSWNKVLARQAAAMPVFEEHDEMGEDGQTLLFCSHVKNTQIIERAIQCNKDDYAC